MLPLILLMAGILHQLIGSLSHDLQGFIHVRWCRISAINSTIHINQLFTAILQQFVHLPILILPISASPSIMVASDSATGNPRIGNAGSYTSPVYNNKGGWNSPQKNIVVWSLYRTLPETNMAPENRYLEKEIPIGNHHLKVPC